MRKAPALRVQDRGRTNKPLSADYIGFFLVFFFVVVVVVVSSGVWVVIVGSVGAVLGVAIGSGEVGVGCWIVLGGTSVVVGAGVVVGAVGMVCGSPGAGDVVCARAAVERVAAARPARSAIRMEEGPFGAMTFEVAANNAPAPVRSLPLSL